jgi:hypothetical protein
MPVRPPSDAVATTPADGRSLHDGPTSADAPARADADVGGERGASRPKVGKLRREHAPNAMGNFEFDVTLGYRRLERPRRAEDGL